MGATDKGGKSESIDRKYRITQPHPLKMIVLHTYTYSGKGAAIRQLHTKT